MAKALTWKARRIRAMHRLHARVATRGRAAGGFVSTPEPRSFGLYAKGKQLLAGNLLLAGHLVETRGRLPWDLPIPSDAFEEDLHRFGWLDDLAAVGDPRARQLAVDWIMGWIDRYGDGSGAGWAPELTGRRLIRLISHAMFVLRGQKKDVSERFFRALGHQTVFLSRRWRATPPGLARFEALTGTIYGGLSLIGMEARAEPAIAALSRECERQIDATGGLPTRNPEELLEVLSLLTWAAHALSDSDRAVPEAQRAALARIAPTLRALRHSDGGLARFHGGGKGIDGRLDQALSAANVRGIRTGELAMGFARMQAGRTSIIFDAAPPPTGPESFDAHASTLAFELTSGRRPVVVNCGSGARFGEEWRRAGRATPSHSTLGIDRYSSSRLGPPRRFGALRQEVLIEVPGSVGVEWSDLADGTRLELSHDGYARVFGVVHGRSVELSQDGRGLVGEDFLSAVTRAQRAQFDKAMDRESLQGIPYAIRFHLHPDVTASLDLGGAAVSMALKSGEVWIFRQDGSARMTLEPSVYLEHGRLRPRSAQQVVLSGRAMSHSTRVRWSLAKAQETPNALRDLATIDQMADVED